MFRKLQAMMGNEAAKEELKQLDDIKADLVRQCNIPAALECGISKAPLRAPIVFSPFGTCWTFNKKDIVNHLRLSPTCPETRNSLSGSELISDDKANRAVAQFNKEHDAILAEINKLSSRTIATSDMFNNKIIAFQRKMAICEGMLKLRQELYQLANTIPAEFRCQITKEPLNSPRVSKSGNRYEAETVQRISASEYKLSPSTHSAFLDDQGYVVDSPGVKQSVKDFKRRNAAFKQQISNFCDENAARKAMQSYKEDIEIIIKADG